MDWICVDQSYGVKWVVWWGAATSAVPYTKELGKRVVDALLGIAFVDCLRPHIPVTAWAWLKRLPLLPRSCRGRTNGTTSDIVHHVRGLGDIEILKSYFLLIWSEWNSLNDEGFDMMEI